MPYFEKRGENYRIVFHLGGKRYRHALKTSDESGARSVVGGVERTIMLIEQRTLNVLYLALIAFWGECCRIVVRLQDVYYAENLAKGLLRLS